MYNMSYIIANQECTVFGYPEEFSRLHSQLKASNKINRFYRNVKGHGTNYLVVVGCLQFSVALNLNIEMRS